MPYAWYFFGNEYNPLEHDEYIIFDLALTQDQAYERVIYASVSSTLVPTQSTDKVLPKVTTYLEPEQEIRSSIYIASVTTTLSPTQTYYVNIKNGVVSLTLEPTEKIDTSGSILSNASQQEEILNLEITFSDSGSFTNFVEMILEHTDSPTGYIVARSRYRLEHIWLVPYSPIPRIGWGNFLATEWWTPFNSKLTDFGWRQ